jgi:hypothetical protein
MVSGSIVSRDDFAGAASVLNAVPVTTTVSSGLSTLGQVVTNVRKNLITVYPSDSGQTPGVIFSGTINNAWGDFNSPPEVPFRVERARQAPIPALVPARIPCARPQLSVATLLINFALIVAIAPI